MSTTTNNPSVQGTSIELLYQSYVEGKFIVNRKYQRKLVWNLEEKRAFIDSIIKGYPTPLILVANYQGNSNNEIIDGLQRLNAVFSFIDGKYGLVGEYSSDGKSPHYFDPMTFSVAFSESQEDEGRKYITKENCMKILRYVLPISTYTINESEEIEEVFRRINSSGRHLSKQEIRQAGSTNKIANLVRRVSAHIRGDASMDDVIPLKSMQKISLTDDESISEGIQFSSTFWLKQGILDKEWLRQSKDEEIVLDILLAMLLGITTPTDSREFDKVYNNLAENTQLLEKINSYSDSLESEILKRFSRDIDTFKLIYPAGEKFSFVFAGKNTRVPRYFESMFFAIDHLLHVDHREIINVEELKERLRGIGARLTDGKKPGNLWIPPGSGVWKVESKKHNFNVLHEILSHDQFSSPSNTPAGGEASISREARLTLDTARIESSRIEFKQGFSEYNPRMNKYVNNDEIFETIAETAAAMSNTEREGPSYIFVGICDDDEAANKFSRLSGVETVKYKNVNICGIEQDIEINGSEDEFLRRVNSKLMALKTVKQSFVNALISDRHIVNIEGRRIMMFKITPQDKPVAYKEALYVRKGPQNSKLGFDEAQEYVKKYFRN